MSIYIWNKCGNSTVGVWNIVHKKTKYYVAEIKRESFDSLIKRKVTFWWSIYCFSLFNSIVNVLCLQDLCINRQKNRSMTHRHLSIDTFYTKWLIVNIRMVRRRHCWVTHRCRSLKTKHKAMSVSMTMALSIFSCFVTIFKTYWLSPGSEFKTLSNKILLCYRQVVFAESKGWEPGM